ncbi:PREDICTED: alcohol dehydrogenase-like [Rhagoletis zephyria]|uniref:alcohol dehydrogenase-like n=1 Tax=Rhagoletis zephyria TaxID=28612 RepID=UPI000811A774|nr:PREDICTED: alcohol dehydrogenase-like [Rhagoletis zephyria]XP_036344901.1 alcohol dehydrogenase-like [Rhagoletis pomonella]XP_036344922.1 alcohol dehydrogenase-like [Rhagoletis pomonella]
MDLSGKNVIYEGGFGGIGQRCLQEFLAKGVKNLAIFDLQENATLLQTLQNAYPDANIFFVQFDITKKDSITAAFKIAVEKMGHFDLLVNGCGLMDDNQVELMIDINLMGLIHSTFAALPYMDKSTGGRGGIIINISSVAGLEPTAAVSVYSAAKHGVTAFTRCMANPFYFKHHGVTFITICPGITETALVANPHTKSTFKFAAGLAARLDEAGRQSPEICAKNLVKVAETGKNGGVYMLDLGEIKEITFPVMWEPVFKS